MECCGKEVETPYCPFCGKRITSKPIYGLLQKLKLTVRALKTQYETKKKEWTARYKNELENTRFISQCEKFEAKIRRWESWSEELEKLIEKNYSKIKKDYKREQKAQADYKTMKAQLLELELKIKQGKLVRREDIKKERNVKSKKKANKQNIIGLLRSAKVFLITQREITDPKDDVGLTKGLEYLDQAYRIAKH